MDLSKKQVRGCLNLKFSIIISYAISEISNVLLFIILFLSDKQYKWIGALLHIIVVSTCLISLKNLLYFTNKVLIRYKSITRYYTLSLLSTGLFYIIIIIYCFSSKTDIDLIYFYTFCIIIWCVFHYLFITIIYSFLQALGDRPAQTGTSANLIDKNLKDLMINS